MIIIGAGLGGLALAQGLRRQGFPVDVYERDAHPGARPQGYRIQLDEPGLTGLSRCLPAPLCQLALDTAGAPPARVVVRDRQLAVLADRAATGPDATGPEGSSSGSSSGPGTGTGTGPRAFDRPTLRQILLAGLEDRVHHGARLVDHSREPDGTVTARFADGSTATADLLIGADGVGSAVRRQLLPHAGVEDAGLRLVYGRIPLDPATRARIPEWAMAGIFTVVTGGPGRPHLGVGPVEPATRPDLAGRALRPPVALAPVQDYLACLVGAPVGHPGLPDFAELRRLGPAALRELATGLFGPDWHPELHELLRLWDTDSLFPLRISTAVPGPSWEPGPVTLIGDAVHAMSPVLAMGANTALRDAGELLLALTRAAGTGAPLVTAVREYESRMADYAFPLVAASRETGRRRVGQS
ncbi:FAD-dependent monooxygenase [Kitasatospora sp. NBC_01287]|uniref:FAD-dependent oxidoreductase n=1 Tax=Kitasatospora sp. NBC_01287 TaxID=2903573 RepID=UPI002255EAF5|nr:NAD(P)/FAD-dependent oxidoreductase [Kitasatospora sp. NBC_01287]MCX4744111.1 FAD-dependent monooxygenase [Kitasatospora sp. NBC_01287]